MKIKILLAACLSVATGAFAAETAHRKLAIDHPLVVGALSRDTVRQIVHLHSSEVRGCYQAELKRKPGLGGRLTASFVIDVTGAVSHVKISETTLNNSNVANCMINHVTRWHFPRPEHGQVLVEYPWRFSEHT